MWAEEKWKRDTHTLPPCQSSQICQTRAWLTQASHVGHTRFGGRYKKNMSILPWKYDDLGRKTLPKKQNLEKWKKKCINSYKSFSITVMWCLSLPTKKKKKNCFPINSTEDKQELWSTGMWPSRSHLRRATAKTQLASKLAVHWPVW